MDDVLSIRIQTVPPNLLSKGSFAAMDDTPQDLPELICSGTTSTHESDQLSMNDFGPNEAARLENIRDEVKRFDNPPEGPTDQDFHPVPSDDVPSQHMRLSSPAFSPFMDSKENETSLGSTQPQSTLQYTCLSKEGNLLPDLTDHDLIEPP